MKGYRCRECGTGFSTTGDTLPPSPRWDDGHVCEMVEIESKINSIKFRKPGKQIGSMLAYSQKQEEEAEERLKIIAQNGPSGLHYVNDNDANFVDFQTQKEKSLMFRKEGLDE